MDIDMNELRRRREAEPSEVIKERVNGARRIQNRRYGEQSGRCNARMGPSDLRRYCDLDDACASLMRRAFDTFGLTARSYDKILKVARTIADLAGSKEIQQMHIAEAIRYRTVDFGDK